jgi:spore germination protein GerM
MIRARAILGVVLLAVGAAACGIPADDGPRAITQDQRPAELESDSEVTSGGQTLVTDLYFTRFDGSRHNLVPIERAVVTGGSSSRPTPATVLEALLAGVPDDEQASDLVTRIPADTALDGPPDLDSTGVLTVYLSAAISGVQGDGARLAYGQLVCTADALDEVRSVRFAVDGQPVQAPTGEGETSNAPLTCDSYDNLTEGGPAG